MNDRQIQEQPDGSWNVWCRKHGKRYTMQAVATEAEAIAWWREHTGSPKGPALCPQMSIPLVPNPFE